jgi:LPS-assembly protein
MGALLTAVPELSGQTSVHNAHPEAPPEDQIYMSSIQHEQSGDWYYLRGVAKVETTEFLVTADEIDYNSDTHWAYARGHVKFEHFADGEKLNADHCEYNLKAEEGKFYVVDGTSPAKVMNSPGLLTTTNPFYFQSLWAERLKDRYILHKGFVTDCNIPKPWWTFSAPLFDIVPGERAIGHGTIFRLKNIPVFYLPLFYRPLGKNDRQSGFLTPNIGNSSRLGFMVGLGYYWAINRSYDMTLIGQYFTSRGPAENFNFRGKPNNATDFNFQLYAVQDLQGQDLGTGYLPVLQPNGTTVYQPYTIYQHQGGEQFEGTFRTAFDGFTGLVDYNYLSSYLFRESFTQNFATAINSEVDSTGFLQRHFDQDTYVLNFVMQRTQFFESATPQDDVTIQKLPSVEFSSRDQQVLDSPLPVWVSFTSSGGLMNREEPIIYNGVSTVGNINTANSVPRIDVEPRVSTEFKYKGFSLTPSLNFGATQYGDSWGTNSYAPNYGSGTICLSGSTEINCPFANSNYSFSNGGIFRHDIDFSADLRLPTLEKIYTPPKWLHMGAKLKHVIEAQATYDYITGIHNFDRIIHFDSTDLLADTNQVKLSLTNRVYKKEKNGSVSEVFTWSVAQERYFDPTFGGAVQPYQRNVIFESEELTPFAFLNGPRSYSPVVSIMRFYPVRYFSIEWRTDYDPMFSQFVDRTLGVSFRASKYFVNVGQNEINAPIYPGLVTPGTAVTAPTLLTPLTSLLTPKANQVSFSGGFGNTNRRGWNAGASTIYDYVAQEPLYEEAQVSYNSDCCGFSGEYRRFNFGTRHENQFLFSFALANIGTFGSMRKQDRIF